MKTKKSPKAFLINAPFYETFEGRPKLLRIVFSSEHTKVDFGYQTDSKYIKGGWVRIAPITFIRFQNEEIKYVLKDAVNIPISPNHHYFNTQKDWLYFSLYFPAIDLKSGKFDIIEAENGDKTDFNYYNITINMKNLIEIK